MTPPIRCITLIGAPLATSLAAAIISARLPNGACELTIIRSGRDTPGAVYSRPDIRQIHQLLQITEDELRQKADAEMVMALPYKRVSGEIVDVPLGDYGLPRRGCDFQHYWQRAHVASQGEEIEHYNFALRLHKAGCRLADTPKDMPLIDPAYRFDSAKYAKLLMGFARVAVPLKFHDDTYMALTKDENGRHNISLSGQAQRSDLIIDMRGNDASQNRWTVNYLPVPLNHDIPGLALFMMKSALERLFSLWPDMSYNAVEPREYNRLAREQQSHIDGMSTLLSHGAAAVDGHERLERKITLFQSRGRLAYEDYDIFSKAEWISVLRGSGIQQAGYDRLADRESLGEIQRWLDTISRRIDAHIKALKGQRS